MAQAAYPETPPNYFGTRAGSPVSFPYLALHREEFTWPIPVTRHAGELLPHHFTHHPLRGWNTLCCTCRRALTRTPGRYPARCPTVFGLSSFTFVKAITRRASLQGSKSITKYVEQSNIMLQEPCSPS